MKTRYAYCSACDQQVPVVATTDEDEEEAGLRPVDPSSLTCMAYGEQCTGDMCPLFEVPSAEMQARWRRAVADEQDPDETDADA